MKVLMSFSACTMLLVSSFAIAAIVDKPGGFLWYNVKKESEQKKPTQRMVKLSSLSYQQRDKVLNYYTMEALHKARQTHNVKDMARFLTIQKYWLNEASMFQHNFEYALMRYPAIDYEVQHPASMAGQQIQKALDAANQAKAISSLTTNNAILFFYKGSEQYSVRQAPIIADFANKHHFTYIPVAVDGVVLPSMPKSRVDSGQAKQLGVSVYPSVVLVNPKSKAHFPVASGFVTQGYLAQKMMVIHREISRSTKGKEGIYD